MTTSTPIEKTGVPLTEGQLKGIGRVVAEWSLAQNVMEHLIWVLIPTDQETGRLLTTHMSDETRCGTIRLLSTRAPQDLTTEIRHFLDVYDDLRKERNKVVHNVWAGSVESDLARGHKPSARGHFQHNTSYWSEADIVACADDISAWSVGLWWPHPHSTTFSELVRHATVRNQTAEKPG